MKRILASLAAVAVALVMAGEADACTRVAYAGHDGLRIVGRSLDWRTPIPTNLYVYPRGLHKIGHSLPNAVEWTSKYGAVYAVSYDGGVTEGMNEAGLAVNGLFCTGTVYENDRTRALPPMSLAMFPAWILDQCATTAEAVQLLRTQKFNISGASFDEGTAAALHWGITDAQGNSAVVEFSNGDINIYEGDLPVLTNDPPLPQMQAIEAYWQKVGGKNMLPGTVKSADRFVRATYFVTHVDSVADAETGVAICRSVLVNCSVPYTYNIKGEPNLSATQWRSYANLRDVRYYFDIVTNLGVFYVDLTQCNLQPGATVLRLDTSRTQGLVGNVTALMQPHPGFTPLY